MTPTLGHEAAFPIEPTVQRFTALECGLSKREWFAAMVMQGLLANAFIAEHHPGSADVFRRATTVEAVLMADALIEELSKEGGAPPNTPLDS